METKQLMDRAELIMKKYACRDLEGEVRLEMGNMVHRFFRDHVRRVAPNVVMERMSTPMKALAWFNTYLCQTFNQRCCTGTASADACTLA